MGKLSSLLAFGFVLVSLQRCQGQVDVTTCHQVENCFQFFESPTCNPDGTRQVCLTWTDFAGCGFVPADQIRGICKMNNFTPTPLVDDGQQVCDLAIGGTKYTFGIQSIRPGPFGNTNTGPTAINGYKNNGGMADCQGFASVCAAGGNNDFSLAFHVSPCPTPPTIAATTAVTVPPTPPGCTCGNWGNWGGCSATCGPVATRSRYRTCSHCPLATPHRHETVPCPGVPANCPIDGAWTQWNNWAGCSATCGSGTDTRTRSCTNPPPQFNGLQCPGSPSETIACVLRQCDDRTQSRKECKRQAKSGTCAHLRRRARKQCIKRECPRR